MRIAAVGVIRDERDVLPAFVAHTLLLFDDVLVIDHRSQDGSREFLRDVAAGVQTSGGALELLTYDEADFHQAELTSALVREALRRGADWVIALDADEFLDVTDRADLEARLSSVPGGHGHFTWLNVVPTLPTESGFFDARQPLVTTPTPDRGDLGLVAVSRTFARRNPFFVLTRGNHRVASRPGRTLRRGQELGRVLHIPARSRSQVKRKGVAYRKMYAEVVGTAAPMLYPAELDRPGETARAEVLQQVALRYDQISSLEPIRIDPAEQFEVRIRALPDELPEFHLPTGDVETTTIGPNQAGSGPPARIDHPRIVLRPGRVELRARRMPRVRDRLQALIGDLLPVVLRALGSAPNRRHGGRPKAA